MNLTCAALSLPGEAKPEYTDSDKEMLYLWAFRSLKQLEERQKYVDLKHQALNSIDNCDFKVLKSTLKEFQDKFGQKNKAAFIEKYLIPQVNKNIEKILKEPNAIDQKANKLGNYLGFAGILTSAIGHKLLPEKISSNLNDKSAEKMAIVGAGLLGLGLASKLAAYDRFFAKFKHRVYVNILNYLILEKTK